MSKLIEKVEKVRTKQSLSLVFVNQFLKLLCKYGMYPKSRIAITKELVSYGSLLVLLSMTFRIVK